MSSRVAVLSVLLLFGSSATVSAAEYRIASLHARLSFPDDWLPINESALAQANELLARGVGESAGKYVAGYRNPQGDDEGMPYVLVQAKEVSTRSMKWSKLEHEYGPKLQSTMHQAEQKAHGSTTSQIKQVLFERDRSRVTLRASTSKQSWVTYQYVTADGVFEIHGYERPERMTATQAQFQTIADSVTIDPGHEFVERSSFDWSSPYGAGIVSGVVAGVFAGLMQFRRRRKPSTTDAAT